MANSMGEVRQAWEQVEGFRKNDISDIRCGRPVNPGKMDPMNAYAQAQKLLQDIGKQVCADEGVKWGTDSGVINDKTILSKKAKKKFHTLLDFIKRQWSS